MEQQLNNKIIKTNLNINQKNFSLGKYLPKNASTSFLQGIEGIAPNFVMHKNAAEFANNIHL
jgi:hypothetical protein